MSDTTDSGKPRLGLISPFAMRRLGARLAAGAAKHGDRTWERGMAFSRVVDSLERHLAAYKAGDADEDHLAAVMSNAMFLAHYEGMVSRGVLPAALNDLPRYVGGRPV